VNKIIITGGTGFIGRHLIRSLLIDSDNTVTLVTRNPRQSTHSSGRIDTVSWDLKDLTQAIEGARCVVNLAGEPILGLWTKAKRKRILESRVGTGTRIRKAIEKATHKPDVLIQASAVGYYGNRGDEELDEHSSRGNGFLSEVSEQWENSIQSVEDCGVRECRIRSGIVLGDDGFMRQMMQSFRFHINLIMGTGRQWIPWIHMRDEIGAIRFLMDHENAAGVFNLTNPNPVRYSSLVRGIAEYHRRSLTIRLPAILLRVLAGDFAREVLLANQRVLPRRLTDLGFRWKYSEIEDALGDLLATEKKEPAASIE